MMALHSPATAVEEYARALRERDLSAFDGLMDPHVAGHEQTGEVSGIEAFRSNIQAWLAAYPDFTLTTDDLFEQADRAAWRWTLRGTHARTGRAVDVSGIIIFRLAGGRIAEYWGHYDRLALLEQEGSARSS